MIRMYAALALVIAPAIAMAEEAVFVIDPARSSILAFGSIAEQEGHAQSPGSDNAIYSGQFHVNLTDSTIQFLDGSFLKATNYPLPLEPNLDGAPGSFPANYGFATDPGPFGVSKAALRDFVFTVNSSPITMRQNGPLLQFNNTVQQGIESGRVEFFNGTVPGAKNYAGFTIPVDDDNVASLSTENGIQTLRFHFYSGIGFDARQDNDSLFQFSGDMVATRAVPEPGGVGTILTAAFLLVRRLRRSRWDY